MRINRVTFISDNLKLKGEIYIPETGNPTYPATCLCHGISAGPYNPHERSWPILAEKFCRAGFITMIFNFRGAGLSEGNFDILGWAEDLKAALKILLKTEGIDKKRLYLLGSSAGATAAIYVTAQEKQIAGLVTLGCPSTFGFVKANQGNAAIQRFRDTGIIKDSDFPPSIQVWLEHFERVTALRWIDKIAPRPILIMHGDMDDVVPIEHAHQLYKLAGEPKEMVIIPGAGHRLRLVADAVNIALNWMQKQATLI